MSEPTGMQKRMQSFCFEFLDEKSSIESVIASTAEVETDLPQPPEATPKKKSED